MKKKIMALILCFATIIPGIAGIFTAIDVFAANIDESKIIGVENIYTEDVIVGTSFKNVTDSLPSKVTLHISKDENKQSENLHSAKFEEGSWELFDAGAISIENGKLTVNKNSTKVKALTGDEYEDFVLEATIKGISSTPDNNFGVMLRAEDVTESGPDSYNGYYVGIGKNDGKYALVVGYANGSWHLLDQINFDYQANHDYDLKVVMYGNIMAIFLDGELMYNKELTLFDKGRVGLRTYRQLFECSSFNIRTISSADLAEIGITEYDKVEADVNNWSCSEYASDKAGSYIFKTTVKGTEYEVNTVVNVVPYLEINEELKALSYENVSINDGFFREYIKQMICKVVPTAIKNVEQGTGGMANIKNAAKKHRGETYGAFSGMFFVDSDVHKVLESMCYALSIDPLGDEDIIKAQADISSKLEEWIPYFVDAQEDSGYFDTYYILKENEVRFSDVSMHELYCMGHFIEAAIAHYECTDGKDTRLLEVAVKCADYLSRTFGNGEGQRKQIGGHQEIEIALLKLAKTMLEVGGDYSVKAHKYANLAAFFLEVRGDYENRTVNYGTFWNPEYWQDHAKVEDQTSAVGHSVRAQYMYTAMAELASIDSEYREKYDNALTSLWKDVTYTKQYVTGGVGQSSSNEGFLESYKLPNGSAYCETCAGISNMMWNRSMSKLYSGSAFADQIETNLYNAVLGCVNLDGDKFYYVNALESTSGSMRSTWYGTACCPPNLTRTILSLGGYIYNYSDDALYVNQYISNEANVPFSSGGVKVNMTSDMPWKGNVSILLSMDKETSFKLNLRIPYWSDKVEVKINGKSVNIEAGKDGYIVLDEKWSNGDKIELSFSMPVIFEETSEKVTTNIGYTSVRRGPIVYCAEYADNKFRMSLAYIDKNSEIKVEKVNSIDGKADPYGVRDMYIIKMGGKLDGLTKSADVEWAFIPFYARLNRTAGHMTVYVAKEKLERSLASYAIPNASYTYGGDSVYNLNDGTNDPANRWTSWKDGTFLKQPWVQYDFDEEVVLSGCNIWWYNDNGGVKLADSFEIYYKNTQTGEFTAVKHDEKYLCKNGDGFITYTFEDVAVTSIRIVINNSKAAAGIVEWELIEGKLDNGEPPEPTPVTEEPTETETPEPTDKKETETPSSVTETPEVKKNSLLPVIIGGVIAAVAVAGAVVAVILKKKK